MSSTMLLQFPARQYKNGQWHSLEDTVAVEAPVTVVWSAPDIPEHTAQVWAFPHHLEELAAGHVVQNLLPSSLAFCEQKTQRRSAAACIQPTKEEPRIQITLSQPQQQHDVAPPQCNAPQVVQAMQLFMETPGLWETTGCFHRAGVFCPQRQRILHIAEDIARHNCIDRLAGWSALTNTPLQNTILLVSARITRTLCLKALQAGFRFLISRSAVSSAAITLAEQKQAALLGFARTEQARFTVFTDKRGLLC